MAGKLTQGEIDQLNEEALSDAQSEFEEKYGEFFEAVKDRYREGNGKSPPVVMEELTDWQKARRKSIARVALMTGLSQLNFHTNTRSAVTFSARR